jgi:tetratricopeptide (TPR) repeat protein
VPGDRPRVQALLLTEAAHAAIDAGELDEADRLVTEVLALDPDAGPLVRTDLLAAQGEAVIAAEELRGLLGAAADDLALIGTLADLLAEQGRHDDAVAVLNDGMAAVALRRDRQSEAAMETAKVWELRSQADHKITWLTLRRSFVEKEAGWIEASIQSLETILEQTPRHADALNALGYLFAEEDRDLQRAESLLTRALEQRPFSGAFQDSMGWVLYRQGRYAEAVEHLERAVDWFPGEPEIEGHLAAAQHALTEVH